MVTLKPPKSTANVKKTIKKTKKTNPTVKITGQQTLSMVLLKTRPELGKFWENKIYKN